MPSDHLREELNKFLFLYAYENKCVMLAISENFQNNDSKGDNVFAGVSFHPFFLLCIRKIIEKYHHGIMTATKLLDLKTLKALCEEWQSVKNQIYIESIEEPGINPSNSSLVAWEIDKISTSKVVPCYEVSLVSKISLFP
ncbi:hypothetical protein Gasu2_49250 [Galdieria sulphuraria]|nr:hypothetical protein Gasu2_49250 [Galdieria sulphuraria]